MIWEVISETKINQPSREYANYNYLYSKLNVTKK